MNTAKSRETSAKPLRKTTLFQRVVSLFMVFTLVLFQTHPTVWASIPVDNGTTEVVTGTGTGDPQTPQEPQQGLEDLPPPQGDNTSSTTSNEVTSTATSSTATSAVTSTATSSEATSAVTSTDTSSQVTSQTTSTTQEEIRPASLVQHPLTHYSNYPAGVGMTNTTHVVMIDEGGDAIAAENPFTVPANHFFAGWGLRSDAVGTALYDPGDLVSGKVAKEQALYAIWVTLSAEPNNRVYDGTAQDALLNLEAAYPTTGQAAYPTYTVDGGATQWSMPKLTNAGTYQVTVSVKGASITIPVTIDKATLDVVADPIDVNYGDPIDLTYSFGANAPKGDEATVRTQLGAASNLFEIVDLTDGAVGAYDIVKKSTAPSSIQNYNVNYQGNTLTIQSLGELVVTGAQGYYGTYDATVHDAVTGYTAQVGSTVIDGVTFEFSTEGPDTGFSQTMPTVTDASDSTTVWVRASKVGYTNSDVVAVSATVLRANLIVTADAQGPLSYNEAIPTLTYQFGDASDNGVPQNSDSVYVAAVTKELVDGGMQITTSATKGSEPNSYPITLVGPATIANYNVSYQDAALTIVALDGLGLQVTGYNGQYDAASHDAVSYQVTVDGEEMTADDNVVITYSTTGEDTGFSATMPTVTDVTNGTDVWVKVTKKGYTSVVMKGVAVVTPAPLTIHADDHTIDFGANIPTLTYSFTTADGDSTLPSNLTGDALTAEQADIRAALQAHTLFETDAVMGSLPSVYDITAIDNSVQPLSNYTVTYLSGSLTIRALTGLSVTAQEYNGVYDATAHNAVKSSSVQIGGVTPPSLDGITITYSTTSAEAGFTATMPTVTDVTNGTDVWVKVSKAGYTSAVTKVTAVVTPAPLVIHADDYTISYGDAIPTLTYSFSDTLGKDTLPTAADEAAVRAALATNGLALSTTATDSAVPASYPITVTAPTVDLQNYTVSLIDGTLTINPLDGLSLTANGYNGTYDGVAHDAVIDLAPTVNGTATTGVTYTYSLTEDGVYSDVMPTVTNVADSKTIWVKVSKTGYVDATISVEAVVTRAAITVLAEDKTMTYGEAVPQLTFGFDAFPSALAGDALTAEEAAVRAALGADLFETTATSSSTPNSYPITAKVSNPSTIANYHVSYKNATLTINSKGGLNILNLDALLYSGTYDALYYNILTATPDVVDAAGNAVTDATITYSVNGSAPSTTMPQIKNAGDYTLTIVLSKAGYDDVTLVKNTAIQKAGLVVSAEEKTIDYLEAIPTLTFTLAGMPAAEVEADVRAELGSDLYNTDATDTSLPNVYDITANTDNKATLQNYNVSYNNSTLTIRPLTSLQLTTAQGYNGTYDAVAHEAVTAYQATIDGTPATDVTYTFSLTEDGVYSETMPTVTDVADSGTVWIKASKAGYVDTTVSVTATVSRANIIVSANTPAATAFEQAIPVLTYSFGDATGNGILPTAEVESDVRTELEADAAFNISTTAVVGSLPNSYPITVTGPDQLANYNVSYQNATLSIISLDGLSVTATALQGTYNGTAQDALTAYQVSINGTLATAADDVTIWARTEDSNGFFELTADTMPTITNVAESGMTIWLKATKTGYETSDIISVQANLQRATVAVQATPQFETVQHDTSIPTLSFTNTPLQGADTLEGIGADIEVTTTATTASLPNGGELLNGNYAVTAKGPLQTANYTFTYTPGEIDIIENTSLSLGATATPYTDTYDANPHDAVTGATASTNGSVDADVTIEYSLDGGAFSQTVPTITDAGNYTVVVKASKTGYTSTTVTVYPVIKQATVIVQATPVLQTVVFNTALPTLGFTNTALQGSDTLESIGADIRVSTTASVGSLPNGGELSNGNYAVTATGPSATKNYTFSYKAGELDIVNNDGLAINAGATAYTGTYDAVAHPAASAVSATVSDATIEYSLDGGAFSETMPQITDAGEYTLVIRASKKGYDDATLTLKPVIEQAEITVTADPKDPTHVFGTTFPTLGYSHTALQGSDLLADLALDIKVETKADDTSLPSKGELLDGRYEITVTGKETSVDQNYRVTYVNGALDVLINETLTLDAGATAYEGSYDDRFHDAVTGVLASTNGESDSDVTITYTVNGGEPTTTLPTLKDAGEYTVVITVTKDGYAPYEMTVYPTIEKAALTIYADPQQDTIEHNTALPTLGYTHSDMQGDDTLESAGLLVSVATLATIDSLPNSGELLNGDYAITASGAAVTADGNYAVTYVAGALTIVDNTSLSFVGEATPYNGIYDAVAHDAVTNVATSVEDVTLTYTVNGVAAGTTLPQITDAEGYEIGITASKAGYVAADMTVTATITPAALTVTAQNALMIYNTTMPTLQAIVGGLQGDDTATTAGLSYALSTTATPESLPSAGSLANGNYPITVTGNELTDDGNYTVSYLDAVLTIVDNNTLAVTGTSYSGVYDALAHDTLTNIQTTEEGVTLSYSLNGGAFVDTLPTVTDAGSYTITVRAQKAGYETATFTQNGTITAKAVTVTVGSTAKTVGTADPAFTASVDGLVGADSLTYSIVRADGETVGVYALSADVTNDPNYIITVVPGTLTITAVPVAPVAPVAPTTPPTTPVDPVDPTAPTAPTTPDTTIEDGEAPLDGGDTTLDDTTIEDNLSPLAGLRSDSWALLNLILTVVTSIVSVILLVGYFAGKRRTEETRDAKLKRKGFARVLSLVPALLSIILFLLTQDMTLPMVFVDSWTLLTAVFAVVQLAIVLLAIKKFNKEDEDQDTDVDGETVTA